MGGRTVWKDGQTRGPHAPWIARASRTLPRDPAAQRTAHDACCMHARGKPDVVRLPVGCCTVQSCIARSSSCRVLRAPAGAATRQQRGSNAAATRRTAVCLFVRCWAQRLPSAAQTGCYLRTCIPHAQLHEHTADQAERSAHRPAGAALCYNHVRGPRRALAVGTRWVRGQFFVRTAD